MAQLALFSSIFNANTIESLKEEEKLLASLIYENAREVVACDVNSSSDEDYSEINLSEKIEITRKNLLEIVDAFNKTQEALKGFLKHFPKWFSCRKNNISTLRDLANRINKDRFNSNIAKVTGSAVGIVGGAALGASLIFPPAALVLAIGGGITSFAGGATVFGSSVTEIAMLSNKMNKAKDVLHKDNEDFEPMANWFKHSQHLIDLMNKIIGFDIIQEISEGLGKFSKDITSLLKLKNGAMHSKLKELIKIFVQKAASDGFATTFPQLIPVVVAFVFVIILFRKNNSLLFDCVVITHRTVFGLMKLLDLGSDLGMLICNAAMKTGVAATEVVTKATAKIVTQGALAGIGIALDVTNLVFASIDIHNGSVSEKAVQLKAASDQLEKELTVVEAVYEALIS